MRGADEFVDALEAVPSSENESNTKPADSKQSDQSIPSEGLNAIPQRSDEWFLPRWRFRMLDERLRANDREAKALTFQLRNLDTGESKNVRLDQVDAEQEFMTAFCESSVEKLNLSASGSASSDDSNCADQVTPTPAGRRQKWAFWPRKRSLASGVVSPNYEDAVETLPPIPSGKKKAPLRPPYEVGVRSSSKVRKRLNSFWLLREIQLPTQCPIWSLSLSADCKWLAAGAHDGKIYIFRITGGPPHLADGVDGESQDWIISTHPARTWEGHDKTIVQITWDTSSGSGRLLSTSLDKTVRLWRPSSNSALTVLNCEDWPTAACFHPTMKDIIFAGTLDAAVQVWKLFPQAGGRGSKSGYTAQLIEYLRVSDLVTSMSVSPSGGLLAVGFRFGRVSLYEARSLRFHSEVDCKNRRGKHARGRKVTGLEWSKDETRICVTTNDSRLRLLNLQDLSSQLKYKGHTNEQIMLHAEFSPSERHLVSGSETSFVHLWPSHIEYKTPKATWSKRPPTIRGHESFKAFEEQLTSMTVASSDFLDRVNHPHSGPIDLAIFCGSHGGKIRLYVNKFKE